MPYHNLGCHEKLEAKMVMARDTVVVVFFLIQAEVREDD